MGLYPKIMLSFPLFMSQFTVLGSVASRMVGPWFGSFLSQLCQSATHDRQHKIQFCGAARDQVSRKPVQCLAINKRILISFGDMYEHKHLGGDATFGYMKGNTVHSPTAALPAGFLWNAFRVNEVDLGLLRPQSSAPLPGPLPTFGPILVGEVWGGCSTWGQPHTGAAGLGRDKRG